MRLQPGRQLQQYRQELPVSEPQQERRVEPQRQPGLPPCPEFCLAGKIPDSRRNRSPSSPPLVLASEGGEIKA
jgi:hypothetical protein